MKKKLFGLSFLIVACVTLLFTTSVFAGYNHDTQQTCQETCPVVHFAWQTTTYDNCPKGYTVEQGHADKCKKDSHPFTVIDRPSHEVKHSVDVAYNKSHDDNKCHRPSDATLAGQYSMDLTAIADFKKANSETKEAIRVCPTPTVTNTPSQWPTATPTVPVSIAPSPSSTPCFPVEVKIWMPEGNCITPTVSPSPTPTEEITPTQEITPTPENTGGDGGTPPTFAGSTTDAPHCEKTAPTKIGANFHVYRNGDVAIAKWFPTEGNKANIYYKQVGSADWQYSKRDVDNNGYQTIDHLGTLDITFALQQANDCAGGPLTNAVVDGNGKHWVLFR